MYTTKTTHTLTIATIGFQVTIPKTGVLKLISEHYDEYAVLGLTDGQWSIWKWSSYDVFDRPCSTNPGLKRAVLEFVQANGAPGR